MGACGWGMLSRGRKSEMRDESGMHLLKVWQYEEIWHGVCFVKPNDTFELGKGVE